MNTPLNCVLLVDDDEATNFINRLVVKEMEITEQVLVLDSADAALAYLAACGETASQQRSGATVRVVPDLIFLDIKMPAMDGWDFLSAYQELAPQLKTGRQARPVLVLLTHSRHPDDEIRLRAFPFVTEYRRKPLSYDMLEEILRQHFGYIS